VDGYIAYPDDAVGPLFDWYGNGDTEVSARASGWTFHVSQASADYVRPFWEAIKVTVIGRHLFDTTNGWDGDPAAGDELVVVTRRPLPEAWLADHPDAPFHTAGSVEAGIALAKKLAGDGLVCVTAGDLGGQAFSAGLVDEIAMDVAPVVLGEGVRFFGSHAGTVLLDDPDQVVRGDRVLHLHTQSSADRPSTAAALGPSPLPIVSFPKAGLLWDGPDAAYDARGSTGPSAVTRCSCTWCWPGSIEPSNVVFAALAECSLVEDRTGWSIRKIVRTVTGLVANGYLPRAKTPPR
jgi:dihydrofolate reductase